MIDLSHQDVNALYDALLLGLDDYSTDERGDVGSWVRLTCIQGLTAVSTILLSNATAATNFSDYLPSTKYQVAVAGILKQGVERLDNVRQEAGKFFLSLLVLSFPHFDGSDAWRIHNSALFHDLFLRQVRPNVPSFRPNLGVQR